MGDSKREFRRKTFNLPSPISSQIFEFFENCVSRTNERASRNVPCYNISKVWNESIVYFFSISLIHYELYLYNITLQHKDPLNIHKFVSIKTTAFYRLRAKTGLQRRRVAPPVHHRKRKNNLVEINSTLALESQWQLRCIGSSGTCRDRLDGSRVNLFRIRWDAFPRRLMAD